MSAAETFHPMDFIEEELAWRGWTLEDVAFLSGGPDEVGIEDYGKRLLSFELYQTRRPCLTIGPVEAGWLSQAFGTSPQLWLRLDAAWQAAHPPEEARTK